MEIYFKLVTFLLWVNFLPPLARILCGDRFNWPVDGGRLWVDQKPVLGHHKTLRGITISVVGGMAVFALVGLTWQVAAVSTLLAMAGDLTSSFIKRRLNFSCGSNVFVLDQFFESFFPAILLGHIFHLNWYEIVSVVCIFIPIAWLGSFLWTSLVLQHGVQNTPRSTRSTVRLREWKACHVPFPKIQAIFNLTSFLSYQVCYTWLFKLTGLYEQGMKNGLIIKQENVSLSFRTLPSEFDGFRILLLTDLHLDGLKGLTEALIKCLKGIEVDLCLIGGDVRMKTYGPVRPCLRHLRRLLPFVQSRYGVLGVLGNHDCIEMTSDFEEIELKMLINEAWPIECQGERIWVVGVDDPHYYRVDDAERAYRDVPENEFTVFLAHSPEVYRDAASCGADLYLCGHTHGGQICLPGGGPILTNSRAPRYTANGHWLFRQMKGYTSRGAGPSGVPLRFNCPGEITLITLCSEKETVIE